MTPDWTRVRGEAAPVAAEPVGVPVPAATPPPAKFGYDLVRAEAEKANSAAARKRSRDAAAEGHGLPTGENPTTSEIDYGADDLEFLKAIDRYKREKRRPYPTCREVLAVLRSLGYAKALQPGATDGTAGDGHAGAAQAVG